MSLMCGSLDSFISSSLYPMVGLVSVLGVSFLAIIFLVSRATSDPRLSLFVKTEMVQVVVSILFTVVVLQLASTLCAVSMSSLPTWELTRLSPDPYIKDNSLLGGANDYAVAAAAYSKKAYSSARYYLAGLHILSGRYFQTCDVPGCGKVPFIDLSLCCIFGGLHGESLQLSGFAMYSISMVNMAFNTSLLSYFYALCFIFFIQFIFSGVLYLFMPLAILIRSIPFMRKVGATFFGVCFAFIFVFPVVLALLYTMSSGLFAETYDLLGTTGNVPQVDWYDGEVYIPAALVTGTLGFDPLEMRVLGTGASASVVDDPDPLALRLFNIECTRNFGAIQTKLFYFAGRAFFISNFIPTLALLAAIASAAYVARLMGEDIDLSRIMQMV